MTQLHNATAYNASSNDLNGTTIAITDAAQFWLEPAGDYDGIVNFEISPDSGTTWFGVEAQDLTSKVKESLVSPPRAGRFYQINIPGTFRLRMAGGTQGSLTAYAELISENGTSAVTVANGADVALGSTTDAGVSTDANGTISAKLRGLIILMVNFLSRFPASLGQKAMSASLPVVVASDQSALALNKIQGAANVAVAQVATSTSAATLVAARATRRGVTIRNNDSTISVYIGPATVTSGNGLLLKAGESVYVTWVGLIQVIAASGTPTVSVWDEWD